MTNTIQDAIKTATFWGSDTFVNKNMARALTNIFNSILNMVDQGKYTDAVDALQNDILKKTDGCKTQSSPDNNDWIKDCKAQEELYTLITYAIRILNN